MTRRGSGSQPGHVRQRVPVAADIALVRRVEHRLAALQFCVQGGQRPLHQEFVQVGEHAHGVRETAEATECRTALVVDEHEVHGIGPVGHGERGHQRLQQFALARSAGARDEQVRPLGQIEHERAAGPGPEQCVGGPAARRPAGPDSGRAGRLQPGGSEERHGVRQPVPGRASRGLAQRSERPGGDLGDRRRHHVGDDPARVGTRDGDAGHDRAVVVGSAGRRPGRIRAGAGPAWRPGTGSTCPRRVPRAAAWRDRRRPCAAGTNRRGRPARALLAGLAGGQSRDLAGEPAALRPVRPAGHGCSRRRCRCGPGRRCSAGCRACGSQRSQFQSSAAPGLVSTVTETSRGLCRTATDSSMARASARPRAGDPVIPAAPHSGRARVTGASSQLVLPGASPARRYARGAPGSAGPFRCRPAGSGSPRPAAGVPTAGGWARWR